MGVVGFCFGGGLGYAVVARRPADALVSFYGSALPQLVEAVPSVSTPSLHVFGESDAYLPMDVVERITTAVTSGDAPTEVVTYPGADHAFDNPDFVNHDAEASAAAWSRHRDLARADAAHRLTPTPAAARSGAGAGRRVAPGHPSA